MKNTYHIFYCICLSLFFMACVPPYHGGSLENYEKTYMVTGYINFPKNEAEIENNRRVERQYINLAPMFGYSKKSAKQLRTDSIFIAVTLDSCKCSMTAASKIHSDRGWGYMKKGNMEIACKRLNQAFLLDSTNYSVPWGFGAIMASQGRFSEAMPLFEKTLLFSKDHMIVFTVSYAMIMDWH